MNAPRVGDWVLGAYDCGEHNTPQRYQLWADHYVADGNSEGVLLGHLTHAGYRWWREMYPDHG